MAAVYILYSSSADIFYVGSSKDIEVRMSYHKKKEFINSFTAKYEDWELYFLIDQINNTTARKIEAHIKKMKSRVYIQNLKKYPEMTDKLLCKYNEWSAVPIIIGIKHLCLHGHAGSTPALGTNEGK